MLFIRQLAVFVICLGCWPVWATDAPLYTSPQMLPPTLLTPPPAEGSKAWRYQAAAVRTSQKKVTADDLTAIHNEQNFRVELMTEILGPDFERARLPRTFALLDRVKASAGQISEADKKFWHTRRPYLTDAHVRLYVDRLDDSPSYPSGHTTGSRVLAEILSLLAPDQSAALRARADAIAYHRIEAGAHYPADIEGGRNLAMLMTGALLANPAFQDDLAAAKNEITDNQTALKE